jgi:hypothetical protein
VGRALTPDSPEALIQGLADAFAAMYRRPAEWKQRGLNGRRRAERQYGWPARIQRALDLYQTVLPVKPEEQNGIPTQQSRSQCAALASSKHSD